MARRHWIALAIAVVTATLVPVATHDASAGDARRGQALYEARCGGCHSESVHGRTKRVASDFEGVRRWVSRWNDSLGARWGSEEVDDVTRYLNDTYYRYACPPRVCKTTS